MSTEAKKNSLSTVRDHLFAQLEALRGTDDPAKEVVRSKAVCDIAKQIIETAKVEVAYVRETRNHESTFIAERKTAPALTNGTNGQPKGLSTGKDLGTALHARQ